MCDLRTNDRRDVELLSCCRKCGADVARTAGAGRPALFCSVGCRRSAEYERRRVQAALEQVEEQLRWCRFRWSGRSEADVPKFDAERMRLEGRLRELLDDEHAKTT